jgi:hypothetical protein
MKKQKTITEIKEDYHIFIDLQMGKYFRTKNINEFQTENEAKAVLGRIITGWNKYVAANHKKFDKVDKAGVAAWFNSIEIDFEGIPEQETKTVNKMTFQKNENITEQISDKELDLIPYCYIVLNALGYKFERMSEIMSGAQPSEFESELIQWSFKTVRLVNKAVHTKSTNKAENILDKAYYMLLEKMDKPEAKKTLLDLHGHLLDDFNKRKQKKS